MAANWKMVRMVCGFALVGTSAGCAINRRDAPSVRPLAGGSMVEAQSAAEALSERLGGVVAMEPTDQVRRGAAPDASAPLDRVVESACESFDWVPVRRGNALALQMRYSSETEEPSTEPEELRATIRDLQRLITPLKPISGYKSIGHLQQQFGASLTPSQIKRVWSGGLALEALTLEQRERLRRILVSITYGDSLRNWKEVQACLAAWPRASIWRLGEGDYASTAVAYPDAAARGGKTSVSLDASYSQTGQEGWVEPSPPPASPPAGLEAPWRIAAGPTDLAALARDLREQGGPDLDFPSYASRRTVWVSSPGATRGEVLSTLCSLWGWRLRKAGSRVIMERPSPGLVRTDAELRQRLQQAWPPAVRNYLIACGARASSLQSDRVSVDWSVLRASAGGETPIARLPGPAQRHVLAALMRSQLLFSHQRMRAGWGVEVTAPPQEGRLEMTPPVPGGSPWLRLKLASAKTGVTWPLTGDATVAGQALKRPAVKPWRERLEGGL